MRPETQKRSTKAIRLLLVSSAFILDGCSPQKAPLPPPALPTDRELTPEELAAKEQGMGAQSALIPSQTNVNHVNHSPSGWSYLNPFLWSYGTGGNGRSWGSNNSWSSGSSNRFSTGASSNRGSGPASFFGGHSASSTASRSTSSGLPTIHSPSTHTSSSSSHVSSPSVSRGGFGGHASSASS